MFGGNLTNHVILFGRKKVGGLICGLRDKGGRRAEGGKVGGQKMVTLV